MSNNAGGFAGFGGFGTRDYRSKEEIAARKQNMTEEEKRLGSLATYSPEAVKKKVREEAGYTPPKDRKQNAKTGEDEPAASGETEQRESAGKPTRLGERIKSLVSHGRKSESNDTIR